MATPDNSLAKLTRRLEISQEVIHASLKLVNRSTDVNLAIERQLVQLEDLVATLSNVALYEEWRVNIIALWNAYLNHLVGNYDALKKQPSKLTKEAAVKPTKSTDVDKNKVLPEEAKSPIPPSQKNQVFMPISDPETVKKLDDAYVDPKERPQSPLSELFQENHQQQYSGKVIDFPNSYNIPVSQDTLPPNSGSDLSTKKPLPEASPASFTSSTSRNTHHSVLQDVLRFTYDEAQQRIDDGFRFMEHNSKPTDLVQVGSLLTHLAKSRHLLRFLRPRAALNEPLLTTLLSSIHRRTVSLLPTDVKARWWQTPTLADGGHNLGESDSELWRARLKTLQDFLCQQQIILFYADLQSENGASHSLLPSMASMIRAGNAMVDDEQYRRRVPHPVYLPFRHSLDYEAFRACPFCHLTSHSRLAECQLKELITCFKCFDTGHAKKYCRQSEEILPQHLLFFK